MIKWIVRTLGLKGSWRWAMRRMLAGDVIYRTTDTGSSRYRMSEDGQMRLEWTYNRKLRGDWASAYFFLDDMECTDWAVWKSES